MQNYDFLQFFTIVAQNYLAYALVLGESVLRYHSDAIFSIFIMDDPDHRWQSSLEARGFQVIYPEHVPITEYRKFVFQYNVTEASTAVKPSIIRFLFQQGAEKVIYLDPDILCFRRLDEVLTALDESCIVLTPHICSPVPDNCFPNERAFMGTGIFNLGFIALKRSESADQFVNWWKKHLATECLFEPDTALFVDQKWVDLAPTCFEHVFILRNTAYNIAYWNLHERILEERQDILYERNSGTPVAFIHFSGISLEDSNSICRYTVRNPFSQTLDTKHPNLSDRPDLAKSFRLYRELILSSDMRDLSNMKYGYATYDNGEPISQLERSLYLGSPAWRKRNADPFATGRGSFRDTCRNAGIRASENTMIKSSASETVKTYALYIRLIEFFLRVLVRLLGPIRYLEFAKYMRHQFLPQNHGFLLSKGIEKTNSSQKMQTRDQPETIDTAQRLSSNVQ